MKRKFIFIAFPIIAIVVFYFLGTTPARPTFDATIPVVPHAFDELEKYVANQESKHKLKPDNEAKIVWADSTQKKTEYSVVYLHGFSASEEEGNPVHRNFAKKFHCNLYLARLADHGIDTVDQLLYFTPDRWWKSCKEALAIGQAIGEKVIVMSTSTGGTMALMLAAAYPQDVFALINMSPNIAVNDPNVWLVNNHWGLQIMRLVVGGQERSFPKDSVKDKYWNNPYRLEAVVQLQELLEDKMNQETFCKVKCPSLTLCYYKNEQEQDPVVKVSAMRKMNRELGTPDPLKKLIEIPNAGGHVLGSMIVSKDIAGVEKAIHEFAIEILKLK